MKRSTGAALVAVLLLAIALRLAPLLRALHWGADFGEYYALTRALAADGFLPTDYDGWGVTYPWFPGFFVVNAAIASAGVPVDLVANVLVPVLAAFAVLPMFLIAVRVTRDDAVGLVAAAFLAVVLFHVYSSSHAIPAALSSVLLLGALLAFLGLRESPKLFVPLVLTGFAIVVTHHLTTYFLLLLTGGALLLRCWLDSKLTLRAIRLEVAFLAVMGLASLAFWALSARPFWTLITSESPVPVPALLGFAVLAFALFPASLWARRRTSWRFRPRSPTVRRAAAATVAGLAAIVVIFLGCIPGSVLGTTVSLRWEHLLWFSPLLLFLSIAAGGRKALDLCRGGSDVTAWVLVLILSFAVGASVVPEELIPYRHMEYFAVPLAVMIGLGIRQWSLAAERPRGRIAAVAVVFLLVAGTAASALPPSSLMANIDESIQGRSVESALWLRDQASIGTGGIPLVAADHRASTVVFGFAGLDATWDREMGFWHTTNLTFALERMERIRVGDHWSRVDWVLVDADMRKGLMGTPFESALPLLSSEEAKFAGAPFHKLFDSGYAQVYFVNWGLVP